MGSIARGKGSFTGMKTRRVVGTNITKIVADYIYDIYKLTS